MCTINYQRFTRELNGHEIPYLVVGSGGHKLHKMQKNGNGIIKIPFKLPDRDDVTLEGYCDDRYGFMRLEVTADKLQGKFFSAGARHQDRFTHEKIDEFELDVHKHKLVG
jgi:hypothetical protein